MAPSAALKASWSPTAAAASACSYEALTPSNHPCSCAHIPCMCSHSSAGVYEFVQCSGDATASLSAPWSCPSTLTALPLTTVAPLMSQAGMLLSISYEALPRLATNSTTSLAPEVTLAILPTLLSACSMKLFALTVPL